MSLDPTKQRKKRMLIGITLGLLLPVGWYGYGLLYTLAGLRDAYAKWDTGTLLIEFMETHDGRWPTRWEDLQDAYAKLSQRSGHGMLRGGFTFDELRSRIGIEWHADPALLATAPDDRNREPFRVVWALSGNATTWSSSEPNQMVLDYLRQKRSSNGRPASSTMPAATDVLAP